MTHNLEENGEDNESEVGVANKLPAETIKEANLVVHDRRRARLLAERAGTIGDVVITIEDSIGRYGVLALHGLAIKLSWGYTFGGSEVNVGQTVHGSIVSKEVEERDGAADTSSGDE